MYQVSLVKCTSYERQLIKDRVAQAINLLGGIGKFVDHGARVLIKPNFLRAAPRGNRVATDPEIVRAVAEMCFDAGASEVMIGDSPAQGSIIPVARKAGYFETLSDLPVQYRDFECVTETKGTAFPRLEIAEDVLKSDTVINIAKAKTHALTGLTLAVKNCFGSVPGLRKVQWHLKSGVSDAVFCRMLVDVYQAVHPSLNIIDAVIGMEGNGPGNGTPRAFNAIAASSDALAADMAVSQILKYPLHQLPIHKAACEMGAGPGSLDDLNILGGSISDFEVNDLKRAIHDEMGVIPAFAFGWLRNNATPRPNVSVKACKRCGQCVEICPAEAITPGKKDKAAVIDRLKCIRCFCCQEICPHNAIDVRKDFFSRHFIK